MEIELAKELMELFFHAPAVNGILVFEDNDYLGVVFKRDIEIGIMEGKFELFENINHIRQSQLSDVIFNKEVQKSLKIPVIDKAGKLLRIISHEEYTCQFEFDSFQEHFKLQGVFDELGHGIVITSHFKKVIYANKAALELVQHDIIGKNISPMLKMFDVEMDGQRMFLKKKKEKFELMISHSISRSFSYILYQFLPVQ